MAMINKSDCTETNDDNYINGKKAFDEERYEEALNILLLSAKKNNVDAQAMVGLIYFLGFADNRNLENAIFWLEKASKNGRGDAAHNLHTLYLTCEPEIPKDPDKARFWLQQAKELGFEVAPKEWYESILRP